MTKADLEKLGERLADEHAGGDEKWRYSNAGVAVASFNAGFSTALELLWPVVSESQQHTCVIQERGKGECSTCDALAELEGRLKIE